MNGAPGERKSRPAGHQAASSNTSNDTTLTGETLAGAPCSGDTPQDLLTQRQRRRLAALRLAPTQTGARDPDYPTDTRCHQPTSGVRASAFREGFGRGALDVLRQLWPDLDDSARARAAELAAKYGGELV